MDKRFLVLDDKGGRIRILNVVTSSGGKVLHDSGGRVVLIDTRGNDKEILGKLPQGSQLVGADQDVKSSLVDLDPSESLFLDALKLRNSKKYRTAKQRRKPGETPEEIELLSGPCTEDDDLADNP